MCTGDTWPYWIELGVSALMLAGALLVAYGSRDPTRQWKFVLAAVVYALTLVTAGALALGQAQTVRAGDGVCVVWGRWALFAATHGGVAALIVMSVSPALIDAVLGLLVGTGSALFLVPAVLTPVRNGGNAESAAILWTVASGVCVLCVALLLMGIALGWRRFILFSAPYKATDGRANVINRWWYIALAVGVSLIYALYTLLYALGPEGWHVYDNQFTQTWLTMALADGLLLGIVLPLVFYLLNPDGAASTATAFESMAPAEPLAAPIGASTDDWQL